MYKASKEALHGYSKFMRAYLEYHNFGKIVRAKIHLT